MKGKQINSTKDTFEQLQMKRAAEERRREKEQAKKDKERVRAQIAEDKERRKVKFFFRFFKSQKVAF